MKCLTPVIIENKRYRSLKLYYPNMTRFLAVPCNKCVNCLKNQIAEWCLRLEYESKVSDTSYFVTLTYDDGNLPADGVSLRDIQLFHKRLRKAGFKFRYYLISEYGTHNSHRAHYHGIYFGLPVYAFDMWNKGFVDIKDVIPQRLVYVCSYHILRSAFVPAFKRKNFRCMSKHLGLIHFLDKEIVNARINDFKYLVKDDGTPSVMPRYYKRKYSKPRYLDLSEFKLKFKSIRSAQDYFHAVDFNTEKFIKRKIINKQL